MLNGHGNDGRTCWVSKAFDVENLNKLLANKADNLEQAEREIIDKINSEIDNMVRRPR